MFGVTLMPDQLQVMNPAMVLLMMPACPGGCCPVLPDMMPLQKMFIGGVLAALSFVAAGILQIGIEVHLCGFDSIEFVFVIFISVSFVPGQTSLL